MGGAASFADEDTFDCDCDGDGDGDGDGDPNLYLLPLLVVTTEFLLRFRRDSSVSELVVMVSPLSMLG